MQRRERTRHLIELGGLVQKAGLVELTGDDRATIYGALLDGGAALMPIGEYGFSQRFGWVNDRFGVSWQLNLA